MHAERTMPPMATTCPMIQVPMARYATEPRKMMGALARQYHIYPRQRRGKAARTL
jgi:hypothetical protein